MIVLATDSARVLRDSIRKALAALAEGRLVVLPTETVYGVAANPRVAGAVERIYEAKGRPENKPIPLLSPNVSAVAKYGAVIPSAARALAKRFWPGPLTLVLETPEGEIGFRVPDHPVALALLRQAGSLLAVTSANRSGEPPATTVQGALAALGPYAAVALDAGPSPGGIPSTVVRVVGEEVRILRAGAIAEEAILDAGYRIPDSG